MAKRVGLPPKAGASIMDEQKIQEIINKGGSTTKKVDELPPAPEAPDQTPLVSAALATTPSEPAAKKKAGSEEHPNTIKQTTVALTVGELARIRILRELRPKPRTQRKPAISLTEWVLEAVLEKLEREEKSLLPKNK